MNNPFFKYLIALLIFFTVYENFAQSAHIKQYPFKNGEEINCRVYYNWGPIWIEAGHILFKTTPAKYNNSYVFHFEATGKSLKKWNWLFKLEDYYQSYADTGNLKPFYYEKFTVEGGYMMHNQYYFDYKKASLRMITVASRKPERDTVVDLPGRLYDVLTSVNYLRTINTKPLTAGDTIQIPVILNGKIFTQKLIYAGNVNATCKRGNLKLIQYNAVLSESNFFADDNAIKVYISDDRYRYPVFITAKIVVGYIKVYITGFEDIKLE